mmetsp:Transcript_18643/g.53188  ORF Transcript_18643/g.53188 Transcript_18643/m.53188 type:complete len:126 (+) Transcript_18643:79-456(+)
MKLKTPFGRSAMMIMIVAVLSLLQLAPRASATSVAGMHEDANLISMSESVMGEGQRGEGTHDKRRMVRLSGVHRRRAGIKMFAADPEREAVAKSNIRVRPSVRDSNNNVRVTRRRRRRAVRQMMF